MREVICDTSPLQYLYQIDQLELLPRLYGRVIVPREVAAELAAGRASSIALPNLADLAWIDLKEVEADESLRGNKALGPGERGALACALRSPQSLIILD